MIGWSKRNINVVFIRVRLPDFHGATDRHACLWATLTSAEADALPQYILVVGLEPQPGRLVFVRRDMQRITPCHLCQRKNWLVQYKKFKLL